MREGQSRPQDPSRGKPEKFPKPARRIRSRTRTQYRLVEGLRGNNVQQEGRVCERVEGRRACEEAVSPPPDQEEGRDPAQLVVGAALHRHLQQRAEFQHQLLQLPLLLNLLLPPSSSSPPPPLLLLLLLLTSLLHGAPDEEGEARGFTRQPENSQRAHLRVTALQTPPKFHEKTPREREEERKWAREREKKARNFGPPAFRSPPFGPPPFWAPHLRAPPLEPPRRGSPGPRFFLLIFLFLLCIFYCFHSLSCVFPFFSPDFLEFFTVFVLLVLLYFLFFFVFAFFHFLTLFFFFKLGEGRRQTQTPN